MIGNVYRRYLQNLLEHKRRVLGLCWREGLYWQGLTHDLSKCLPDEFFASARFFSGRPLSEKERQQSKLALLKHHHRNPHHPEYWLLRGEALPMPDRYLTEMLCDWQAFAPENPDSARNWYAQVKDKITLHPDSRKQLEKKLESCRAC